MLQDNMPDHRGRRSYPDETIDACFLVKDVITRPGRNGREYRMLTLGNGEQQLRAFAHPDCVPVRIGQAVRVAGCLRVVNGDRALVIRNIDPIDEIGEGGSAPPDDDLVRLADLIRHIQPPYRELVERVIGDAALFARFCRVPASTGHHHAYPGGLLRHVIEVMELGLTLHPLLPVKVDASLLLTAGFLHDLGKIDAYTDHVPYALTPLGKAWGHEMLGLRYLLPLLEQTDALSPESGGRLLATLRLIPSQQSSPIPPEHEALITLDGLSVQLSRVGRLKAA